jgi:hypothetical protein
MIRSSEFIDVRLMLSVPHLPTNQLSKQRFLFATRLFPWHNVSGWSQRDLISLVVYIISGCIRYYTYQVPVCLRVTSHGSQRILHCYIAATATVLHLLHRHRHLHRPPRSVILVSKVSLTLVKKLFWYKVFFYIVDFVYSFFTFHWIDKKFLRQFLFLFLLSGYN